MPSTREVHDRAVRAAERVLKHFWWHNITPVNPSAIAERMNLKVLFLPSNENYQWSNNIVSALMDQSKEKGYFTICIKDLGVEINPHQAREYTFIMAYALGLYLYNRQPEDKLIDNNFMMALNRDVHKEGHMEETEPEKFFANVFAANLLMPEKEVHRCYKRSVRIGWDSGSLLLNSFREFFGVPEELAEFRLRELKLKR